MKIKSFIYRQKQRIRYHLAINEVDKQIAEINRYEEKILLTRKGYLIKPLSFILPARKYDYIFSQFDLFISNAKRLNGEYRIKDNYLQFSWDRITVHISTASDLYIINEIFVEKCYHFRIPRNESVSIIDIGMNVGLASLYFASLPFVKDIFSFEPFKPTYNVAAVNLSFNPSLASKILTFDYGLGKKNEILKVPYNSMNPGINTSVGDKSSNVQGSILENIHIKIARNEIERILETRPDGIFMIKMDAEGAEYGIFDNLFELPLDKRIIGIMLEWHKNGPDELEDSLIQNGFNIFSFNLNKKTGFIYAIR